MPIPALLHPMNPCVCAGVSMVWLTADQGQPRTPEAKVSYVVRRQETNLGNLIADSLLLTARVSWVGSGASGFSFCPQPGWVVGRRDKGTAGGRGK